MTTIITGRVTRNGAKRHWAIKAEPDGSLKAGNGGTSVKLNPLKWTGKNARHEAIARTLARVEDGHWIEKSDEPLLGLVRESNPSTYTLEFPHTLVTELRQALDLLPGFLLTAPFAGTNARLLKVGSIPALYWDATPRFKRTAVLCGVRACSADSLEFQILATLGRMPSACLHENGAEVPTGSKHADIWACATELRALTAHLALGEPPANPPAARLAYATPLSRDGGRVQAVII